MKIEEFPRALVYADRLTIDDFLNDETGLNKELYKLYLQVKDSPYTFKFNVEKAFNEAYYIATMSMWYAHPELKVRDWLWKAKEDMIWRYAADLVMSMVYAILYVQADRPEKIEYVLAQMEKEDYGDSHFPIFKAWAERCGKRYSGLLPLRPCPVDELHLLPIDWSVVTDMFQQEEIRDLVAVFPTREERLKLVDLIEQAEQTQEDKALLPFLYPTGMKADKTFFETLRKEVETMPEGTQGVICKDVKIEDLQKKIRDLEIENEFLNQSLKGLEQSNESQIKESERNSLEAVRQCLDELVDYADKMGVNTIKEMLNVLNRYNMSHNHVYDAEVQTLYARQAERGKMQFNIKEFVATQHVDTMIQNVESGGTGVIKSCN